jgi:hypothetical protein
MYCIVLYKLYIFVLSISKMMKTLTINLIGACLVSTFAACENPGRHVVIKTGDSFNETKIEYVGRVEFNREGTEISHISPNGSVKYKHNDEQLVAESDNLGHITYQINDGKKGKQLSAQEKLLMANAVKAMIKQGHYDY